MPDPLKAAFERLARYNRLANERLYEACAALDETALKAQRPAFFGSIHGTLNHIMVGDRIWLARFEGQEVPSSGLDAILYDDYESLRTARAEEDARIERFAAGLGADWLAGSTRYVNHAGHSFADPNAMLLQHLFNHQTHHRGQVHDMLCQTEVAPPSLDLHRVLKPQPDGPAQD